MSARQITFRVRTPKQLGEVLRRERRYARLTQAELAKRAGLRQGTVSNLEKGAGRLDTFMLLLGTLGLECRIQPRSQVPAKKVEDIF